MPNDTVLRFDCRPEHMHDPPRRKFRHMRAEPMFATYLDRWALTPDGAPIATHSSDLLPVRHDGVPAMLKIARGEEEKWGGGLMVWRSEERRGGKEWVSPCRSRWSPYH